MSENPNYTDEMLKIYVKDLDEVEQKILKNHGAVPEDPYKNLEPKLTSDDISRMAHLLEGLE